MSTAVAREIEIDEDSPAEELVAWTFWRFPHRRILVTTGFGMEGCVLIHMIAELGLRLAIVYIDTGFFFPETHELRRRLERRYPQLSFVNAGVSLSEDEQAARYGRELWRRDPDLCCDLRKVQPMRRLAREADVWLSGITRNQSVARAGVRAIDWDFKFGLLKVSPLASWDRQRVSEFAREHDVPTSELHERGYPTVGCTHCTRPLPGLGAGEYSREGRWFGQTKTECGLHSRPSLATRRPEP